MEFDSFTNGESLVNADLVAWVMVGALHLPSAEDVPVTTTSSTAVRFLIRPLNYFDESPATDLTRTFFATGSAYPRTSVMNVDGVNAPPGAAEICFDGTAPFAYTNEKVLNATY